MLSSDFLRIVSLRGGLPVAGSLAIGQRLRCIRKERHESQCEFAKALGGCSQGLVSAIEVGKIPPSASFLSALEHLGYSASYLLTGAGQMLRSATTDSSDPSDQSDFLVRDAPSTSSALQPLSPLRARQLRILGRVPAGHAGPSPVVEQIEGYFPMTYEHVPDRDAFCLRVTGDSMSPIIEEGDLVVISPALRGKVKNGDLVVVQTEGGDAWVKRLSGSRRQAFLVSANPSYPPMLLDPEVETTIIGKVVYTIHRYK